MKWEMVFSIGRPIKEAPIALAFHIAPSRIFQSNTAYGIEATYRSLTFTWGRKMWILLPFKIVKFTAPKADTTC